MKTSLLAIALIGLLSAGCATRKWISVSPADPLVVHGDGVKFTPRDLEDIARKYLANEQIAFDFLGTTSQIWVFPDRGPVLAQLDWGSTLGKPCLGVEIDRQGAVVRHWKGIAVCGTGMDLRSKGLDPLSQNP
jgi:hypothetical protein